MIRTQLSIFITVLFGIFLLINCTYISGITLVYNLRVGETTKTPISNTIEKKPSIIGFTPFAQFRSNHTPIKQSAYGMLATYIYANKSFYARINSAFGSAHTTKLASSVQLDDVLFSVGYGSVFHDYISWSVSGHLGIPTHRDKILYKAQLGTGHVGLGAQIDGSIRFKNKQRCMVAARYIHFFPRTTDLPLESITKQFKLALGNVVDVLFAYQKGWQTQMVQIGYNPTIISNAHITPSLAAIPEQINVTTHNFFGSYRYGFLLDYKPSAIIAGASYGFGNRPAPLYKGHNVTCWISWGINF